MSMTFPKEREANLRMRAEILRRCKSDEGYRIATKELFHRDILFAFNVFYYTYDPRKRPYHQIPFATWEYQDSVIPQIRQAIWDGEDLLIEKSRDMGASWMFLLVYHHEWINPTGGSDFLLGSRIEDYVDKRGDMRSLFEKLRYAHYRLPRFLWPKGFVARRHDNYMKLQNPETGAVISGESNNPNFGTGGRYAGILFDEFAKWESTDEPAWTSAGDATPCRMPNSTPFGAGGQYYNLVMNGKTRRIRLHWSLHPEKAFSISCVWPPPNEEDKARLGEDWEPEEKLTSPWYEKESERRSDREISQELDIDYIGSGAMVYDGKAATSLMLYHKLPDEPVAYYKPDPELMKLIRVETAPRFEDREGLLCVYEEFDPTTRYAEGFDIVEGKEEGDFFTGKVLDRRTKHVVASYFSREDEVIAAKVIYLMTDHYTPAESPELAPWCGIETNGPGLATFDLCILLEMTNLFMAVRFDVSKQAPSFRKGWRTDTASRNELISGIRRYLIDRAGNLNSQRLVGELLTFVRTKTGRAQAKSGTHDDEVFALGIAIQIDELTPNDLLDETTNEVVEVVPDDFRITDRQLLEKIKDSETMADRCLATVLKNKIFAEQEENSMFFGE